jgi:hypothetical protein
MMSAVTRVKMANTAPPSIKTKQVTTTTSDFRIFMQDHSIDEEQI